jgi:hypothetical protein
MTAMKSDEFSSIWIRWILRGRLLLAALSEIAFGLSVYIFFLIRAYPGTSKRVLLILAAVSLVGALGYLLLLDRWMAPVFFGIKPSQRWTVLGAGVCLGVFLLLAGTPALKSAPENIVFLLPNQTVEIHAPDSQLVPDPEIVLQFFSTSAGEVSFDSAAYRGWKRSGAGLALTDLSDNSFRWTGKIGQTAELIFLRSPQGGYVNVSWNDFTETVNLQQDRNDKYLYPRYFRIPFNASADMVLLLAALAFVHFPFRVACGWYGNGMPFGRR